MDVSVTLEDVLNSLPGARNAAEAASLDNPESAGGESEYPEAFEASGASGITEASLEDGSGEAEKPFGELPGDVVVVYVNGEPGTDEQLQLIYDELSALSLNVDQRFEEQTLVLENQTFYLRDGNMVCAIGFGLIAGFCFILCFLKGRF